MTWKKIETAVETSQPCMRHTEHIIRIHFIEGIILIRYIILTKKINLKVEMISLT